MADNVNHPSHYAEGWSNGAEVIDITENLNFNRGNAVKYIARAGKKGSADEVEDLEKAQWYLNRELKRLGGQVLQPETDPKPWVDRVNEWNAEDVSAENRRRMLSFGHFGMPRREWELLDFVPPGVIVEDADGDYYRRISGTGQFVMAYREDIHGQHYEWQDVPRRMFRVLVGPFKEVLDG